MVHLTRRRHVPGHRWHEVRSGPIGLDGELAPRHAVESTVLPGRDVTCELTLECIPHGVVVSGTLRAGWAGVCARCATPVEGELFVQVREHFTSTPERDALGGTALTGTEGDDAYPITEDALDLLPMVRDAILLELPLAPLCKEGCRGLCPWCGGDLNDQQCACEAPRDPRWANLDVLRMV